MQFGSKLKNVSDFQLMFWHRSMKVDRAMTIYATLRSGPLSVKCIKIQPQLLSSSMSIPRRTFTSDWLDTVCHNMFWINEGQINEICALYTVCSNQWLKRQYWTIHSRINLLACLYPSLDFGSSKAKPFYFINQQEAMHWHFMLLFIVPAIHPDTEVRLLLLSLVDHECLMNVTTACFTLHWFPGSWEREKQIYHLYFPFAFTISCSTFPLFSSNFWASKWYYFYCIPPHCVSAFFICPLSR